MRETLRHKEAFEFYYIAGEKRNFKLVEAKFNVSNMSVARWSKEFNWQEQIQLRDIENAKKLEKKTDTSVVAEKANYRKEIKAYLSILRYSANEMMEQIRRENKKPPQERTLLFKMKDIDDLGKVAKTFDVLFKDDMLLLGEATDRTDQEPLVVFMENGKLEKKNTQEN